MAQSALSAAALSFGFTQGAPAVLADISLDIAVGEIVCIVGLSGCGKTTLLRLLGGLMTPSAGTIRLYGRQLLRPDPDISMVFQDYSRSILPWRDVVANVELGLEARKMSKTERRKVAQDYLEIVGLGGFAKFFPRQLSGGMLQRVALARALACKPSILLLDEPFGSLDAPTRHRLEDELLNIWARIGLTIVLVTHDLDEAVYLGQRVAILAGRPATFCQQEEVPIGYPRSQMHTRSGPTFLGIRDRLYSSLQATLLGA